MRGIRSRPIPKGGDQVQANIQGGNSGGSGPTPPPPMTTAAGGTHPTGMHSCSYYRPQRSCYKVMFSQESVTLFTGEGGCGRQPPWADSHCSRQYASYWNAFLLNKNAPPPHPWTETHPWADKTRIHSSRMCTVHCSGRLQHTVHCSGHLLGGGGSSQGVCLPTGVPAGGSSARHPICEQNNRQV